MRLGKAQKWSGWRLWERGQKAHSTRTIKRAPHSVGPHSLVFHRRQQKACGLRSKMVDHLLEADRNPGLIAVCRPVTETVDELRNFHGPSDAPLLPVDIGYRFKNPFRKRPVLFVEAFEQLIGVN